METLLTNAYTPLDQKSKLFETNSVAIETKELLRQKNIFFIFFTKWQKFINRINGSYKMIWKLSYVNEVRL